MDPFERSQVADGCLERRIYTNKLLEMTPPQPYFSKQLGAIIRKATSVEASERYQDAYAFHNALQGFSAPNWLMDGEAFVAESHVENSSRTNYVARASIPGTDRLGFW
jgi:hypothetical protein